MKALFAEVLGAYQGKKLNEVLVDEIVGKLAEVLPTKEGKGKQPVFAPIIKDDVTFRYCSKHKCYEPETCFAKKGDKHLSWCKSIDSAWTKAKNKVAKEKADIFAKLLAGEMDHSEANMLISALDSDYTNQTWIKTVQPDENSFPA